MPGRSVRRDDAPAEAPNGEEDGGSAVPEYGRWVTLYGFVHRSLRYRNAVFGGVIAASLLLFGWSVGALVDGNRVSVLPPVGMLGGGLSLGVVVGYFFVRYDTSCETCGAEFSKERIGKRLVNRQSDGRDRTVLVDTLECQDCGERTDLARAEKDQNSPPW